MQEGGALLTLRLLTLGDPGGRGSQYGGEMSELDAGGTYVDGGLLSFPEVGTRNYTCTRKTTSPTARTRASSSCRRAGWGTRASSPPGGAGTPSPPGTAGCCRAKKMENAGIEPATSCNFSETLFDTRARR